MLNNIINFTERKADKNYRQMVDKMIIYFEITKPYLPAKSILINAVIAVENKRAAGQINELNQLITA